MRTTNHDQNSWHRIIWILFFSGLYTLAVAQSEVQHWKTWVLKDAGQVTIPPPPGKEDSRHELARVKEQMANESLRRQVQYWDAGAPAYRWNELAYKLAGPELFTKPMGGNFWRMPMAWMNMAIFDATIAAWKVKYDHQRRRPFEADPSIKPLVAAPATPSYPCEHAVTAAAAATVLAYFFPEKKDSIMQLAKEAAQSRVAAGVQYPSDIAEGWKLGEQVAQLVIEQAKNDGSDGTWKGTIPNDPKRWRGEYPVGAVATLIKPLVLKSADQFRPPAPPDFTEEMVAMKNFKQDFYSMYQAFHWAGLSGLDYWTDLASQKIFEYRLDRNAPAAARIYTLLNVIQHDAVIAIVDAKYAYFGIRPDQFDASFKPLLGRTPPFPGYPSGHASAFSAAATTMAYLFPADAAQFKKAAQECADSRFYAGIHFPSDNKAGLELGEKLATYIINTWAKKDGADGWAKR